MLRRQFLLGTALVPTGAFAQLTPRRFDDNITSVDLSDIPFNTPWGFSQGQGKFYAVLKTPDQTYAYSVICSHEGCFLLWKTEAQEWFCACYGSTFGKDGLPTSGVATAPLARPNVQIDGDMLRVPAGAAPISKFRLQVAP